MRHTYWKVLFWVFLAVGSGALSAQYTPIEKQKLKPAQFKGCTFVHFWASWCEVCIRELPELLKYLEKEKRLSPRIVDLSHPLAQEKFSRVWLNKIAPNSKTFHKVKEHDHDLVDLVLPGWGGGLPVSVFFKDSKLVQTWNGSVDLKELSKVTESQCASLP